jgi:S-adenosylmethionine:tRNA ribosyltransferase-isomerase
LNTSDYTYLLPPEKIASYPLPQRDTSKLLVYKEREILHSNFLSLPDFLPRNAFLFFNNTKVIPARLHFEKESGAVIEIFLLAPLEPSALLTESMGAIGECTWQCSIGNLKRWADALVLRKPIGEGQVLEARLKDRRDGTVAFCWNSSQTFAEIIHTAGQTPLPPYIKRMPEVDDRERYQTIYSLFDGAVAAPTAGLHFTPAVFEKLKDRNIGHDFLTLHVSAGTFQPIKSENPDEHVMHAEQVIISRTNLKNILAPGKLITAVGTTSMRTLESVYWFGVRLLENPESEFRISQHEAYTCGNSPSKHDAIQAVARYMERNHLDHLVGETSIFIRPGYAFRVCQALITNFHQPGSTLLLLIAAFVGPDWRRIYKEALNENYRFLSYGDSSLLMPRLAMHHP